MAIGTHFKKILIVVGVALGTTFAFLSLADFLGFLPSLPRTLGNCKVEAAKQLTCLHRYDDRPYGDPKNIEWFAKHGELVTSCMEAHGHKLDQHAAADYMVTVMKEIPASVARDHAAQFEEFWHHRWLWD